MPLIGDISPGRPLVVVAVEEEAQHLGTDLPVLLTGMGKVNAATAVASALSSGPKPSEIINLGTAGSLRAGFMGTHQIGLVIQHDFDTETLRALVGRTYGGPLRLAESGPVLATGDVFVSDPELSAALAAQADLVDMEGYAVAAAARACGVPVRVVKHVSDGADDGAVASWTSTVAECSRALGTWLATFGS